MRALLGGGPLSGAQPGAEPRRPARAGRGLREGRAGAARAWSRSSASTVVQAYMQHVQDNAEESVRRVIDVLKDGALRLPRWTTARVIRVAITRRRDERAARRSTSPAPARSCANNFNAPSAVCMAAVLYVFRTLVDDDIPMNAGCLKPLEIVIPEGSMLNPRSAGGGGRRQRRDLARASPTRSTARSA